jgi:hypothetical protein
MPSTIIGSASWNSTGLILSQQSAQEQVTGLVNVQVTYVAPVTKQSQASAKFYTDAPPPIWPTVVLRSELVTNNLYLVDRTIERANGLLTIQANYVGALQRAGFKGYYLREQVEPRRRALSYNYTNTASLVSQYDPTGALRRVTVPKIVIYDERLKVVEFVRIGRAQAVSPPTFFRADMASVAKNPAAAAAADLWVVTGPSDALVEGFLSFEKTTPITPTEGSTYITPTVQAISLSYRLSQ